MQSLAHSQTVRRHVSEPELADRRGARAVAEPTRNLTAAQAQRSVPFLRAAGRMPMGQIPARPFDGQPSQRVACASVRFASP
jgi:hypothetical protein